MQAFLRNILNLYSGFQFPCTQLLLPCLLPLILQHKWSQPTFTITFRVTAWRSNHLEWTQPRLDTTQRGCKIQNQANEVVVKIDAGLDKSPTGFWYAPIFSKFFLFFVCFSNHNSWDFGETIVKFGQVFLNFSLCLPSPTLRQRFQGSRYLMVFCGQV